MSDILAAGDETMIRARLRSFADAGVTDLSVRVLPIGADRDELLAEIRSRYLGPNGGEANRLEGYVRGIEKAARGESTSSGERLLGWTTGPHPLLGDDDRAVFTARHRR